MCMCDRQLAMYGGFDGCISSKLVLLGEYHNTMAPRTVCLQLSLLVLARSL